MDCVVTQVIRNEHKRPETKAVLTQSGRRFGRLVVERRNDLGHVVLRCDCGETIALTSGQVQDGNHYQCESCDRWDRKTPVRRYLGDDIYLNVKSRGKGARSRCENPKTPYYKDYGGRGIKFDFLNVEHYSLHVGILCKFYGLDKQVDRKNNDGDYSPGNVRMVAPKDNIRNRRNTIMIEGVPLAKIAEDNGMDLSEDMSKYYSLQTRIRELVCIRDVSYCEASALVREYMSKPQNDNLRAKSPKGKISVGTVPLTDFIANMGFPNNRALYSAAKDYLRPRRKRGESVKPEELRDHLVMYAIRRDIKSTLR